MIIPTPIGDSLHANLSMINVYGGSVLWDSTSFAGELAFNRRLSSQYHTRRLGKL